MEKKESTNNYLNQSQKVIESNLVQSHKDEIFIFNIERCLSSFADEILQSSNLNISEFDKYNFEINLRKSHFIVERSCVDVITLQKI